MLLWNEVRVRRRVFIFADRVAARLVAVVEQVLLVLRRVVQNRDRSGDHVLHRIPQSPPAARPGTRVQRFGAQVAAVLRKVADRVEVWRRVAVQRRLRPKRHDVLQHREVIDVAGIPRVEARAHVGGADLAVCLQRLCDRHPDGVDLTGHQGRDLRRDRLREWRQPDARGEGRRLVVDVDNLRFPVPPRPPDDSRFPHVEHVGVAVVVVPYVFLIELVQRRDLVGRAHVGAVPVHNDVLTVGVE